MKITDMISITELSRLLKKTRPTVYKYVSDFEKGNLSAIPHSVRKLFSGIQSGKTPKKEIYEYCDHWYQDDFTPIVESKAKEETTTLKEVVNLLKLNERKLNLLKINNYILEELKK